MSSYAEHKPMEFMKRRTSLGSGTCGNKKQAMYKLETLEVQHTETVRYFKFNSFSPDPENKQQPLYYTDNPNL